MSFAIGETIHQRYTIQRLISKQGGFGHTYLAEDAEAQRMVVIKASKTASDRERNALLGELQLLKRRAHPRLPRVYDGFFHRGQFCIAMEYIPGRDVASYLHGSDPEQRGEPLDRPTALRWISQALEALAYLHANGIVHHDVKPANLRVHRETGDIFLLDFDLSRFVASPLAHASDGTAGASDDRTRLPDARSPEAAACVPPEQHTPGARLTPASDVYAVGATLYLLLTGEAPLRPIAGHAQTLRLTGKEPARLPPTLEQVVLTALRDDPNERYPDAQAMLDDLRRLGYAEPPATPATALAPTRLVGDARAGSDHDPVASAAPLPIGETIKERYQIRELLSAHGGFGTTYRAFDVERGHEVVIKASKTAEDSKQDALLAERELLRQLSHPNLPRVYDAFFFDGQLCLSMEYIRGRDVASYLRQEPLDMPTALRWMRQLLETLAYLHSREIVHCDVKPENLRVHHLSGELYLLDFGVSRRNNRMVVRGFTPHFSAPEQRQRGAAVTPAADVYAAGALLYNFLVGTPPPDRAPDATRPIMLPAETAHTIPRDLERIVIRALMPAPEDRYSHARAMLDDLRRVRLPARPSRLARLTWAGAGLLLLLGMSLALLNTVQSRVESAPLTATSAPAASPIVPVAASTPGGVATTRPPGATSTPAPMRTATVVPMASAVPTITPVPFVVQRLDIADQGSQEFVFVGRLPLQLSLIGEQLASVRTVILQPVPPRADQPAIGLRIQRAEPGRIDLSLPRLPEGFRSGQYELLLNSQPVSITLRLQDYLRESRILGIKYDYRHLAAIRPLASYRFQGQDIPGPFGLLYLRPDESSRGGYLRNGDLLAILDTTSQPGWYRVRVKQNFDSNLVGYEGWVLAWVVDDTPPDPPEPGAIQVSWNIRGEKVENVIDELVRRGIPRENIIVDMQDRERIPEIFDRYKANQVVSSEPPEGAWVPPGGRVVLGVRAP